MALTPEQIKAIRERDGIQAPTPKATVNRVAEFDSAWAPTPAPKMTLPTNMGGQIDIGMNFSDKPTFTEKVSTDFKESANTRLDRLEEIKNREDTSEAKKLFQASGQVAGFGADVIESTVNAIPGAEKTFSKIGEGIKWLSETPVIKAIGDKIGSTDFAQEAVTLYDTDPDFRDTVDAAANIVRLGGDVEGALSAPEFVTNVSSKLKPVVGAVQDVVENVSDMFKPSQAAIDDYVLTNFEKSVKPTVAGKSGSVGQLDAYRNKAVDAVNIITENKPNLKFKNADGEDIIGRTPKTMQEFAESIDQTKKSVFDKYDALAKQAGSAGGEVGGENIVKELDVVKNNKALAITNPEAVKYADDVQKRLSEFDADGNFIGYKKFDTNTAQDIIKNYNNSLEAFYRNPTYDNASRAAIDAGVVNNFRKELDSVIEGLTGEEYQALKNQYASLKAIEKDVVKRANILARQNNKSLLDYSDIFSGGEMVAGILSLNPALFAKGVVQRGIKELLKYLNSPNRAVKKMFEAAERAPSSMAKPNMQAGAINFGAELTPRTKLKLPPEVKDNIVKIIDDYRLNKGKDLTLQEDAARIAEDLNLPKAKNYAQLVNMLEDLLSKQKDDVRSLVVSGGKQISLDDKMPKDVADAFDYLHQILIGPSIPKNIKTGATVGEIVDYFDRMGLTSNLSEIIPRLRRAGYSKIGDMQITPDGFKK